MKREAINRAEMAYVFLQYRLVVRVQEYCAAEVRQQALNLPSPTSVQQKLEDYEALPLPTGPANLALAHAEYPGSCGIRSILEYCFVRKLRGVTRV